MRTSHRDVPVLVLTVRDEDVGAHWLYGRRVGSAGVMFVSPVDETKPRNANQITELLEEKTSVLDQYIQMQQENKTLKDQVS